MNIQFCMAPFAQHEMQAATPPPPIPPPDAQPDPEPAAPSLPGPDPGVFHHNPPAVPAKSTPKVDHA